MKLKNRRIYAVEMLENRVTKRKCLALTFGKNEYGCHVVQECTLKDFFKYAKTWKIVKTGSRGGEHFVNLLDNPDAVSSRDGLLIDFLAMAKHCLDIKDEVVYMRHGSYLLELDKFIPSRSGKIAYQTIKSLHGYTIKFNTNGIDGFSILKNDYSNAMMKEHLWSIKQCEDIIDVWWQTR